MALQELSNKPRLSVDFKDVELRDNVTRVFHQAMKYGSHPVIKQGAPWEQHSGMTASAIYDEDEGVFKAWYMAGFYAPGKEHVQCMARPMTEFTGRVLSSACMRPLVQKRIISSSLLNTTKAEIALRLCSKTP